MLGCRLQERKHIPAIIEAFEAKIKRKNEFDEAWESPDNLESFVLSDPALRPHLPFLQRCLVRWLARRVLLRVPRPRPRSRPLTPCLSYFHVLSQKKKDIYVANPVVDAVLTIIFLSQIVWVAHMMHNAPRLNTVPTLSPLVVFSALMAIVAFAVALTKVSSRYVGNTLAVGACWSHGACSPARSFAHAHTHTHTNTHTTTLVSLVPSCRGSCTRPACPRASPCQVPCK